jgi:FkbM family methyltransferase
MTTKYPRGAALTMTPTQIEQAYRCTVLDGILPPGTPSWCHAVRVADARAGGSVVVLFDARKARPHVPPVRGEAALVIRPDDVVVDIGAFVGVFAARCAASGARARAYEPNPTAAAVCRANGIETWEAAVVGEVTAPTVSFEVRVTGLGCSSSLLGEREPRSGGVIREVPAVSFREATAGATVVKIDVEGAEYAYPIAALDTLRAVLIDFHPWPDTWRTSADALIAQLTAAGFVPVVPPQLDSGSTLLMGSLFTRERPAVSDTGWRHHSRWRRKQLRT